MATETSAKKSERDKYVVHRLSDVLADELIKSVFYKL